MLIRGRGIGLSREVRDWFHDRGHLQVRLIQSVDGQVALIGAESGGYTLKRSYINGGLAFRDALKIDDKDPHRFELSPATDFEGLIVGDSIGI